MAISRDEGGLEAPALSAARLDCFGFTHNRAVFRPPLRPAAVQAVGLEALLAQQRDRLVREETVVATTVGDDRPVAEIWKLVWRLRHTMLAANVKAHGPPPPLTENGQI